MATLLTNDRLIVDTVSAGPRPGTGDAVYLGFGICTRGALATGDLPLDALAMILVADAERSRRGASQVIHLVADVHALANPFVSPAEADRVGLRLASNVAAVTA